MKEERPDLPILFALRPVDMSGKALPMYYLNRRADRNYADDFEGLAIAVN